MARLAADEALRLVAETVLQNLRTGDRAYRCDDTALVVLLPEQTPESARIAAKRIREAVAALAISHAGNPPWNILTLSAGIAAIGPEDHAQPSAYRASLGPCHGGPGSSQPPGRQSRRGERGRTGVARARNAAAGSELSSRPCRAHHHLWSRRMRNAPNTVIPTEARNEPFGFTRWVNFRAMRISRCPAPEREIPRRSQAMP